MVDLRPMIIITDTNFQQILHCIKSFRRFNQFKLQDQIGHNIFIFCESVSHSVKSDSSVTPWTVAHQAPLSMEFSRQNPGIEPRSPTLQADSLLTEPPVSK